MMLTFSTVDQVGKREIPPIKGSRFIGILFPISNRAELKSQIALLKKEYSDATHVCSATRTETKIKTDIFGQKLIESDFEYADDDGEPSYSAGKPILRVLQGYKLHNVGCAVIRYYGGTNLGIGGLIKAYTLATKAVINHAKITDNSISIQRICRCDMRDLPMLIKEAEHSLYEYKYSIHGEKVDFELQLPEETHKNIEKKLSSSIASLQRL